MLGDAEDDTEKQRVAAATFCCAFIFFISLLSAFFSGTCPRGTSGHFRICTDCYQGMYGAGVLDTGAGRFCTYCPGKSDVYI